VNRGLVGGVAAAVVMLGGAAWFAKDAAWADRLMRAAGASARGRFHFNSAIG